MRVLYKIPIAQTESEQYQQSFVRGGKKSPKLNFHNNIVEIEHGVTKELTPLIIE